MFHFLYFFLGSWLHPGWFAVGLMLSIEEPVHGFEIFSMVPAMSCENSRLPSA